VSLSKWIDLDLEHECPADQGLGWLEQPPSELLASYAGIPWFDEICAADMVPRSEWKDRAVAIRADLRSTVAEIYSQGRTSACVGFGTAQAVETTHSRRYGRKHRVPLSGMSVYDQIGSTLRSGAYIPDGIEFAQEVGPLPLRTPETQARYAATFPGLEWKWSRPAGWKDTAKLFRVTKAAKAQGAEMTASALLKGRCGIGGRKVHCVPYVYLDFSGNSPVAAYANSWSPDWGDAGFGYDSERVFGDLVLYVILEVAVRPDIQLPVI
jgi:hypothetical protein